MMGSPRNRRAIAAAVTLLGLTSACAGGRRRADPRRADAECPELPGNPRRGSTFVFALTEPVDPRHAPVPTNDSEAILFGLLYETLVEVDCDGTLRPGLAESWEVSEDGHTWTFRLRKQAWFAHAAHEGRIPVDARAVRAAWRETRRRARRSGEMPWTWKEVRLRDIEVLGDDRISITFEEPRRDVGHLLSRPEFAVAARAPAGGDDPAPRAWPAGTRGVVSDPFAGDAERDLVWWPESKDHRTAPRRITFRVLPGTDPRDLAESEVDAFFVRDRAVVAYLEGRSELVVSRYPWSTTYFLLTRDGGGFPSVTAGAIDDLARRVTDAEARPARAEAVLGTSRETPAPGDLRSEIVYPAGDRDARAIAERVAFLAAGSGLAATIRGLSPGSYRREAAGGTSAAYIRPARRLPAGSLRRPALLGSFPWLEEGGRAIPLVETRGTLVTRRGLCGIRPRHDGVPRLEGAGWARRWGWP